MALDGPALSPSDAEAGAAAAGTGDPALADPALADPALADSGASDPASIDPVSTDPASTDPASTDPAPDRPRGLHLDTLLPLRDAVAAAFRREIEGALNAVSRAPLEPADAVHDFRRAVRRSRAIVRLVRGALGQATYEGLDRTLAELGRASSGLRDAEVLPAALRAIEPRPKRRLTILLEALEQKREQAYATGTAARVLGAAEMRLAPLAEALHGGLPPELSWDDLVEGLRLAYRRARKARDLAKKRPHHVLIHDWRKRVKEVRHQLELLTPGQANHAAQARVDALRDLGRSLGDTTDVLALRQWLQRQSGHGELRATLMKAAKARIVAGFDAALTASRDVFRSKARRFSAEVAADAEEASDDAQLARDLASIIARGSEPVAAAELVADAERPPAEAAGPERAETGQAAPVAFPTARPKTRRTRPARPSAAPNGAGAAQEASPAEASPAEASPEAARASRDDSAGREADEDAGLSESP
ncbi:MAG: CHAD domain-containing protein [Myxococcales bacterium]|nr:CHAD domain-containing protein [Myxococcales bacterium]